MQVKVFQSENMATALRMVKETLGPDALILSTRTVRKGGGFFGKPLLEVTAAVEPETAKPALNKPVAADKPVAAARPARTYASVADDIRYEDIWAGRRTSPVMEEPPARRPQPASVPVDTLRGEIDELRSLVQGFVREMAERKPEPAPPAPRWAEPALPARKGQDAWLAPVMAELSARGLEDEVAETIARYAGEKLTPQQVYSPGVLDSFFHDALTDLVQVSGPVFRPGEARRLALVGPTGVGKTTTIAKLAADYLLQGGQSVALVTIDTYRIAAVEQLKVYGEIMNVPVEVVVRPEQMEQVFARHRDKDLILIDTAGRSPKDDVSLRELGEFLHPDYAIENHLVLSATTRERDLGEVIRRFQGLGLKSLMFTKLDECESLGALINVPVRHNFPISYLGNGQRVPEDLLLAEARRVAGLILGKE